MITILYFARFREKLGVGQEQLELPEHGDVTVQTVLDILAARGGQWAELFECERGVLAAVRLLVPAPVVLVVVVEAGVEGP